MSSMLKLLIVAFFFGSSKCQTDLEYLQQMSEYIANYTTYQQPTNNAALVNTSDSTLYDFGTFDFVIVGGGVAGCVLASRLSEISSWKILLIEAGDRGNNMTDMPAMLVYSINSKYNWGYKSTPQSQCCQGMRNHSCNFPRGRGLGGSSLINAMLYVRGNADDYNQWVKLGNPSWSYGECLPYFKKSETADFLNPDLTYHGTTGPVHVNHTGPSSVINDTYFQAAAFDMGLNILDYNGKEQIGVGKMQSTINFNKRASAASAYVNPIEGTRSNLNVSLNSFATKIVIKGTKAVAVEFIKDGRRYLATASKEVLVTAGAVNSAQLLMLSGIGPKAHLRNRGIPVIKDLPVGKHFVDHPVFVGLIFTTKLSQPELSIPEQVHEYQSANTPLTRCFGAENIAFANVNNDSTTVPDIEFIAFAPPRGGDVQTLFNFNDNNTAAYNKLNMAGSIHVMINLAHPKSTGSVKLQSNSSRDFPLINLGFYTDDNNTDINTMLKGVRYVIQLFTGKQFGNIDSYISYQVPECLKYEFNSDDYWYCAIRQLTMSYFHPSGTTRMGRLCKDSVVNASLVVHGMDNLRVVGEGAIPRQVAGHLYGPVLMMAEKISDRIKQDHGVL
ncbi:glucose dehydrogenase [FAD, quinone]-like [Diabrotica virgifera virgifera]|uniref:Glucose-methanol-choline oxidoreductase N-terminal domain-containing protein n=1 Tax=Diabrotica virgifera virgifera TaxID=50390 RepID=A0ABM5INQ6_DIAVI|nr:glucose dehydrogenase [FAD, quinone]-like [Diabrotica virgifera virgifera]